MKTSHYTMLILAALLPLAAVAASSGMVFAQYSCPLQVGSMSASMQNYGNNAYGSSNSGNVQMTVPISMSCSYMGNQLWAVGTVYDTVTNQNLGSNNIVMSPNGGYYSGQLVFTLPYSVVEHLLQVQISVYSNYNNGQYSSLVASSSPTVTIHTSMLYNYNNYNSYNYNGNQYYYCNGYYYCSYNSYYPSYYYYSNGYTYYYYPYNYYYSYPSSYYRTSCFNGQTIIYYNGGYYYATCYGGHHHGYYP